MTYENLVRAGELRAKARRCRPGSTLIREYLQQACELDPGHLYRPSQPGWQECQRCSHVRQAVAPDPRPATQLSPAGVGQLSDTARAVYREQQLYQQDRALHIPHEQTAPFMALDALSDRPLQSVGAAWSEALRGAAQIRADLAAPFLPGRKDSRDMTMGMPWEMRLRRPGANVSPHPVLTAHMYPRVRNGRTPYQPGTWSMEKLLRVRTTEGM